MTTATVAALGGVAVLATGSGGGNVMERISPDKISEKCAELLEPKPTWNKCFHRTMHGSDASDGGCWRSIVDNGNRKPDQPLDFLHDPRGTVMLIKALLQAGHDVGLERIREKVSLDLGGPLEDFVFESTLELAVARAFLRSHNIEVED